MSGWLVDAHVHIHDCFPLPDFLAGALTNLSAGAQELGLPQGTPGCLMLTESAGADYFRRLRDGDLALPADWKLRPSAADPSVVALYRGQPRVVLIAGRQIATRERLEVLALGWDGFIPDGAPISEVLERVRAEDAGAVIPWGFGKWWGRRGAQVAELVELAAPGTLFLGDNGGRPRLAPRPRLFRQAAERGVWTLPGSDPLPFPWQAGRAGSYGIFLPADPELDRPASQIKELLRSAESQPIGFGQREQLLRFVRAQANLRIRHLSGRRNR
ncbi:MAG: hypothetical protein H0W11_00625 [Gemmatimonadetes bacterium]|nr:hypothetical protein [Gemmatimonadota bacterium]